MSAPRRGRAVDGILLLDKPVGISSNQALQQARRLFSARKAGHTGNLDVLASGLLPLCFGEATKVCQFLLEADKVYAADFTLGRCTSTGDAEGEIVAEYPLGDFTLEELRHVARAFVGAHSQIPPMHSALKYHGQPLYRLAQRGIEVARAPREVTIHEFAILAYSPPTATVEVRCSKGTYIRTLAEDFGTRLGCGAFVSALRRLAAGPYALRDAHSLTSLGEGAEGGPAALDDLLLPADSALACLPEVHLDAGAAVRVRHGQQAQGEPGGAPGLVRLYGPDSAFLGVGRREADGRILARRLFAPGAADAATPHLERAGSRG